MNKRISLISVVLILTSFFLSLTLPVGVSAIIADYDETVKVEQTEAEAHIFGEVVAVEKKTGRYVDYDVVVTEVERGAHIEVGQKIRMSHDCNAFSEMHFMVPEEECIADAPKIGDKVEVYMNWYEEDSDEAYCGSAVCPATGYRQAVIYGDEVLDIYRSDFELTSSEITKENPFYCQYLNYFAGGVSVISLIILLGVFTKKKTNKIAMALIFSWLILFLVYLFSRFVILPKMSLSADASDLVTVALVVGTVLVYLILTIVILRVARKNKIPFNDIERSFLGFSGWIIFLLAISLATYSSIKVTLCPSTSSSVLNLEGLSIMGSMMLAAVSVLPMSLLVVIISGDFSFYRLAMSLQLSAMDLFILTFFLSQFFLKSKPSNRAQPLENTSTINTQN